MSQELEQSTLTALTANLRPLRSAALSALAVAMWFQIGCATAPLPQQEADYSATKSDTRTASDAASPAVRNERPGLGTKWGERRESRVESTYFVRASKSRPLEVGKAFYNDEEGAKAMLLGKNFHAGKGPVTVGGGLASFALQDSSGRLLPSYQSRSDRIFVGKPGRRYAIVAENLTSSRLELVLSVDGLDVIDGEPASYSKRGYVLDAGERLKVAGFRESDSAVAAFRFGSVDKSYSERRHGTSRNVGVIGVAVFHEQGTRPKKWSHTERKRRMVADPFPATSRFAKPPPAND